MRAPYRFAFGQLASFSTTIVEVTDSDGVVGVGEAPHGDLTAMISRHAERLVRLPVDALNEAEQRCVARTGFSLWDEAVAERRAYGGIEIALWDLRARRAGVPVADLLGGRVRDTVAFTEYFAARVGAEETPSQVIDRCVRLAGEFGSPWFEGKIGVFDVDTEIEMIADLGRAVHPAGVLRVDGNGAYTVPTARRVCRKLSDLDVAWFEDPCRTLDEMARLRADGAPISFSTHQADLPRAARTGVPDAFCLDISELGGFRRTQDFLRACSALGTEFWCYSGDAGIMTAAYLHLTATEASMIRPHQSLFRFTADVVIEQGPYSPTAGVLAVPDGPGLGVTIDRAALARMHERYRHEGPMASNVSHPSIGGRYRQGFTQQ